MSHDVGPVQLSDIQEASEYMKGKLQPTPLVQLWDHKDVSFLHLRSPPVFGRVRLSSNVGF